MIPIRWVRLVELARTINEDYRARGDIDIDLAVRLVRGIVTFQEQLVGKFLDTRR